MLPDKGLERLWCKMSLAGVSESSKRRKGEFINIMVGNKENVKEWEEVSDIQEIANQVFKNESKVCVWR